MLPEWLQVTILLGGLVYPIKVMAIDYLKNGTTKEKIAEAELKAMFALGTMFLFPMLGMWLNTIF